MEDIQNGSLSPTTPSRIPKLRLPATCDPPSEQNPPKQAVWIIFGATGHMGHSLVRAALSHGDQVTAVGWTSEDNAEQTTRLESESCQFLVCDVRIRSTVARVIEEAVKRWGRADIIVNCTGYGVLASCEDQSESDLRNQFETNFLGTLHIISLSLPYFRTQLHGRYLIFSSTAGALGVPGLGPYCATKYAVEGLIESMLYEIDAFGIKATLVEPGHVRLDEPESDNAVATGQRTNSSIDGAGNIAMGSAGPRLRRYGHFFVKPSSAPYAMQSSPAGHARRLVRWLNDRQPTSAVKSAELVWQLGHCSYPPLRLLLGSYAVESIRDRLKSVTEEIEDWKHLSFPVADEAGQEEVDDDTEMREGGEDGEGLEGE